MKLVTFDRDGAARLGAVAGDLIVDLCALADAAGESCPETMLALIEAGPAALDNVKRLMAAHDGAWPAGTTVRLADTRLLAPIQRRCSVPGTLPHQCWLDATGSCRRTSSSLWRLL